MELYYISFLSVNLYPQGWYLLGYKCMVHTSDKRNLLLSIRRDCQLRTSLCDKRDDISISILQNFPFLNSNIPFSPAYGVLSQFIRYARVCSSHECFILKAVRLSNKLLGDGHIKERLKSSQEGLWSVRGSYQTIWSSFSRMLHDILDDDHIQRNPPLIGHYTNFRPLPIWTLLPNWTFYLIVQGFYRTFATGAACQQRILTPPNTWSCPTLGTARVLISPQLVLFPDFWVSNIPRYFSFACICLITWCRPFRRQITGLVLNASFWPELEYKMVFVYSRKDDVAVASFWWQEFNK